MLFFPSDLFAFAIGLCVFSTIIAASRDVFAYVTSGRTRLLSSIIFSWVITALKSSPLLFLRVSYRRCYIISFFSCFLVDSAQ